MAFTYLTGWHGIPVGAFSHRDARLPLWYEKGPSLTRMKTLESPFGFKK